MSTLWTPYGERPVPGPEPGSERPVRQPGPAPTAGPGERGSGGEAPHGGAGRSQGAGDAERLREALDTVLRTPMAEVVTEIAVQLRELALVHLSSGRPESVEEARLAIDAMGAIAEGLGARLAPHDRTLQAALAEVRLAFVQATARLTTPGRGTPTDGSAPPR